MRHPTIRIAAALIEDVSGRMLLVRKAGTRWFMQAGGKIEDGESPVTALIRELREELGLCVSGADLDYMGCFSATAANETGCIVEAELFRLRTEGSPETRAEIAEAVWVCLKEAASLPLAPLTREHVLPLWFAAHPV